MTAILPTKPPAVIFDLDGTLVDTLDDLTFAVNVVLADFGLPAVERMRMRGIVGDGLMSLLQRASGLEDPGALAAMIQRYKPVYAACMLRTTRPYEGVPALLDALTAMDASMCVLSNKPHEFTNPICGTLLSRWRFVRCLGQREGTPRKPHPGAALALASEMQREPADVLFAGDSTVDVQTARGAGMFSVAVTWGFRERDELMSARPDRMIDRPMELIQLVRERGITSP